MDATSNAGKRSTWWNLFGISKPRVEKSYAEPRVEKSYAERLAESLAQRPAHERQEAYATVGAKLQDTRDALAAHASKKKIPLDSEELVTNIRVTLPSEQIPSGEQKNIHHQTKRTTMAHGKKKTPRWMMIATVILFILAAGLITNKAGWWPFGSSTHTEKTVSNSQQHDKPSSVPEKKTQETVPQPVPEGKPSVEKTVVTTTDQPATVLGIRESVLFWGLLVVGLIGLVLRVSQAKKGGLLATIGTALTLLFIFLFSALSIHIYRSKRQIRETESVTNLSPSERKFVVDSVRRYYEANPIRSLVPDPVAQQQRDTAIQRLIDAQNEFAQERLAQAATIDSINRIMVGYRVQLHADSIKVVQLTAALQQKAAQLKAAQKPTTKQESVRPQSTVRVDQAQTRQSTKRSGTGYAPQRVVTENNCPPTRNGKIDRTQDQR